MNVFKIKRDYVKGKVGRKRPITVHTNSELFCATSWIQCDIEDNTISPLFILKTSSIFSNRTYQSAVRFQHIVMCGDFTSNSELLPEYNLSWVYRGIMSESIKEFVCLTERHSDDFIFEYYLKKNILLEKSVFKFFTFLRVNTVRIDKLFFDTY
jgi:hypothetical protein